MPKGKYIRTKPPWNKGKKGLQVAWNKDMPLSEEHRKNVSIGVLKSEKYIKHCNTLTHVTEEHKKLKRIEYREKNKEKVKGWKKNDYLNHRDKYIERATLQYKEHPESKKEYSRKYQQDHMEAVLKKHVQWYKDNPEKLKSYSENRRAQKKIGGGKVSAIDIKNQYLIQGGLCYWCEKPVNENYHLDHLIPLSKGGIHSICNIVISCPKCNLTKNNKMPEIFRNQIKEIYKEVNDKLV